jgi:hypothetical protein
MKILATFAILMIVSTLVAIVKEQVQAANILGSLAGLAFVAFVICIVWERP